MTRWISIPTVLGLAVFGLAATAQTERELTGDGVKPSTKEMPWMRAEPRAPARADDADIVPPTWAYVVEEGDTLTKIASQFLGSESEWRRIAEANGIDDPAQLRAGQRLSIPPARRGS
jgi:nucleoid-associated protein YgaU